MSRQRLSPGRPAESPLQAVYDGQEAVGYLAERGDEFVAYNIFGRHLGTFKNQRDAMRALPPAWGTKP
jgi:hypothetical protein